MSKHKLHLRYLYTFYTFGEILSEAVIENTVDIQSTAARFKLHEQEDGSFTVSEVKEDYIGKYVILTFPGKDNIIVRENDEVELAYDEYFSATGDDNHNVYEGTVELITE